MPAGADAAETRSHVSHSDPFVAAVLAVKITIKYLLS